MIKVVVAATLIAASSSLLPALPWSHWYQLKEEVSVGGHDGECEGIGKVTAIYVTRGEAGPMFRMWHIATPAREPARWVAVELRGTYAEPTVIFKGTTAENDTIVVESVRPYPPGSNVTLCELLDWKSRIRG